jgi:hypothetical protein
MPQSGKFAISHFPLAPGASIAPGVSVGGFAVVAPSAPAAITINGISVILDLTKLSHVGVLTALLAAGVLAHLDSHGRLFLDAQSVTLGGDQATLKALGLA